MLSRQNTMDYLLDMSNSPSLAVGVEETWSCSTCTFDNKLGDSKCEICHTPRPFIPSSGRKQPGQEAPFKITATDAVDGGNQTFAQEVGGAFANGNAPREAPTSDSKKRKASNEKKVQQAQKKRAKKAKVSHGRPAAKEKKTNARHKQSKAKRDGLVYVEGKKPTKTGMKFVCGYCDKEFKYMTNWKSHERVHTGEKIFLCKWPGCNKKFAHLSSLQAHIAKHKGIKPFECAQPGCGKKFANKSNLNRHMRKIHKLDTQGNKL